MKKFLILFFIMQSSVLAQNFEKAYFAGGCFWCMEESFEKKDGVIEVISGYSGGKTENPTYKEVTYGNTGHFEVVEIIYDKGKISFSELCEKPLSTVDYLNLCNYVKVLFIENIPQINNSQNDSARRFINLIDILYEAKVQLICFSSVNIEDIYIGKKLEKEFMRTVSRLNEMISSDWVN